MCDIPCRVRGQIFILIPDGAVLDETPEAKFSRQVALPILQGGSGHVNYIISQRNKHGFRPFIWL